MPEAAARPFGLSSAAAPRHRGPKSARFLRAEARAQSQEPRAKSQEPRAKSQEPRAKSQEPRSRWIPAFAGMTMRKGPATRQRTKRGVLLRTGTCAALPWGPSGAVRRGRKSPQGRAQARAWMPEVEQCRSNCRMRGGRVRGVSFLWPTLLWTSTAPQERRERRRRPEGRRAGCPESRKVGRRPLRATKPAKASPEGECVRRPWRRKKHTRARSRWIPAFAGMTSIKEQDGFQPSLE
jgi:hypothetical protein